MLFGTEQSAPNGLTDSVRKTSGPANGSEAFPRVPAERAGRQSDRICGSKDEVRPRFSPQASAIVDVIIEADI
jgi:hypothetical protein